MNKKTVKIISILLTFVMVMAVSASVFAADAFKPGDMKNHIDTSGNGATAVQNIGGDLIGLLQVAGVVVAIVVLIVLGIKYMMGSTAEKAEYKKTMMPYFIGAILIFGAVAVAGVVYDFATQLSA